MNEAQERTWEVVRRAYEERPPRLPRARKGLVLTLVAVSVVVAAAAVATPSGHAVFERFRRAVGVEHAAPALFSLPAQGRLLVVSAGRGGVWLVQADGLKRRIGAYDDAEWSPHGLYLVATQRDELVALGPDGTVRWILARRAPRAPRWEGTRVDTRIAYLTAGGLRVVAGDGTGDRLLDRHATAAPPAWDPKRLHTVAYSVRGAIVLRNADTDRVVWRVPVSVSPSALDWSSDGKLLAVEGTRRVVVLGADGTERRTISMLGSRFADVAFKPGTHELAVSLHPPGRSEVRLVDVDHPGRSKLLFAGPGAFGGLTWSPAGAWLLVTWPTADQWVFLHGTRVRAVGNIRQQFPRADRIPPLLQVAERWCCSR